MLYGLPLGVAFFLSMSKIINYVEPMSKKKYFDIDQLSDSKLLTSFYVEMSKREGVVYKKK